MSIRLPLIVAAALLVTACDKDSRVPAFAAKKEPAASAPASAPPAQPPATKVAEARPDCCCRCPEQAVAPARPVVKKVRHVQPRKVHRVHRAHRERRYADTRLAGAYVSVEERETYSERYLGTVEEGYGYSRGGGYRRAEGYERRESSGYGHGYRDGGQRYQEGYRRGYDYGDYDRSRPPPPQARSYPLAGRDRDGYLQWPAKVGY